MRGSAEALRYRRRVFRLAVAAVAIVAVALAVSTPPARASTYTQVLHAYQTHGSVPPCQFSSQQLESALKGIDTYGAQYFADFTSAVQTALAARAGGACAPVHAHATPPSQAAGAPLKLGSVTAPTGAALPAPIVLMAVLGALGAMIGLAGTLAWWRGWSPARAAACRHAFAEAGYRASGTWSEFTDWLRPR
jgi:hypothetical protein